MTVDTQSGRHLSQNADELRSFIDLLRRNGVVSYLEIGARDGDTFYEVVNSLPIGSKAVAVDLPGGKWGWATSRHNLRHAVNELRSLGYEASVIFGDSGAAQTIQQVMVRGPYDAVLIDADHRYEAVKRDWDVYGKMASMVAFHDIAGDGIRWKSDPTCLVEVPRLWREIRATGADTVEIVSSGSGMGIGVVLQ
jgi:hypothetical protein